MEKSNYYCSEDCASDELPVTYVVVSYLSVQEIERKAAIIQTAHPIFGTESTFVIVAKGDNTLDQIDQISVIGVYLLPLDNRAHDETLDLSNGLQPVIDWGAITISKHDADKWQVK